MTKFIKKRVLMAFLAVCSMGNLLASDQGRGFSIKSQVILGAASLGAAAVMTWKYLAHQGKQEFYKKRAQDGWEADQRRGRREEISKRILKSASMAQLEVAIAPLMNREPSHQYYVSPEAISDAIEAQMRLIAKNEGARIFDTYVKNCTGASLNDAVENINKQLLGILNDKARYQKHYTDKEKKYHAQASFDHDCFYEGILNPEN